ncbi:hypothetical protein CBR_g4437 [Chara braunii]|uniref:SP-RING-type domain-containing protein n=1 Tax=Chara braunii TaxID=69332 RepID=A0A388KHX1_CHABU|nr:hypothetical protein CBR_g4437 [Chara braunii]|eukprot:GBG69607.1 hypothetical protein CBR_g4437 [Chara braunii]
MEQARSEARRLASGFRIKELKEALARLGMPKQGNKQILRDRLLEVFESGYGPENNRMKEEALAIIEDVHKRMSSVQGEAMPSLPGSIPHIIPCLGANIKDDGTPQQVVRCPCGSNIESGKMVLCDGDDCLTMQHRACVGLPENTENGEDPEPPFHCEQCRVRRADPFSVLNKHILTSKLRPAVGKSESNMQSAERNFIMSKQQKELLARPAHELQVWSILLNDAVPFRLHWPAYTDLQINGTQVRVTNRPGQQKLGQNGRDDFARVTDLVKEGMNQFSISAYDDRPFCVGIRIVKRRTVDQVLALVPSIDHGEKFDDALARVKRCISGGGGGGGNANDDDDDDSDLEMVAETVTVSLRCPLSGSRIKTPARFHACPHMGCFDLQTYVELNQRARKWQCPICMRNASIESLIIDPFFSKVINAMREYDVDEVTEVEMNMDATWRPRLEGDERRRVPWRNPYGVLIQTSQRPPLPPEVEVKQEVHLDEFPESTKRSREDDDTFAVQNGWNRPDRPEKRHKGMNGGPLISIGRESSSENVSLGGSNSHQLGTGNTVGGLSVGEVTSKADHRAVVSVPPTVIEVPSDSDDDDQDTVSMGRQGNAHTRNADGLYEPELTMASRPPPQAHRDHPVGSGSLQEARGSSGHGSDCVPTHAPPPNFVPALWPGRPAPVKPFVATHSLHPVLDSSQNRSGSGMLAIGLSSGMLAVSARQPQSRESSGGGVVERAQRLDGHGASGGGSHSREGGGGTSHSGSSSSGNLFIGLGPRHSPPHRHPRHNPQHLSAVRSTPSMGTSSNGGGGSFSARGDDWLSLRGGEGIELTGTCGIGGVHVRTNSGLQNGVVAGSRSGAGTGAGHGGGNGCDWRTGDAESCHGVFQ